ncbi:MAG: hypothetical protein O3B09_04685 [Proteobacteria bacterium]|nr:hypothetical protein [Pseudomonadota bacterium]
MIKKLFQEIKKNQKPQQNSLSNDNEINPFQEEEDAYLMERSVKMVIVRYPDVDNETGSDIATEVYLKLKDLENQNLKKKEKKELIDELEIKTLAGECVVAAYKNGLFKY